MTRAWHNEHGFECDHCAEYAGGFVGRRTDTNEALLWGLMFEIPCCPHLSAPHNSEQP